MYRDDTADRVCFDSARYERAGSPRSYSVSGSYSSSASRISASGSYPGRALNTGVRGSLPDEEDDEENDELDRADSRRLLRLPDMCSAKGAGLAAAPKVEVDEFRRMPSLPLLLACDALDVRRLSRLGGVGTGSSARGKCSDRGEYRGAAAPRWRDVLGPGRADM